MKINSLALVIAEPFLKRDYPGGVMGFMADQVADAGPNLHLLRQGNLVVLADPDPDRLLAVSECMLEIAWADPDDDSAYVIVDPEDEDALDVDCDWLSCERLDDGSAELCFTGDPEVWEVSVKEDPFQMCLPLDGADTIRPDDPKSGTPQPTLVRLAEVNGLITWLDTETGRQLMSPSPPKGDLSDADAEAPMLAAAAAMIERRGWEFERDDDGDISFSLNAGPFLLVNLRFIACSRGDVLLLVVRIPGRVPASRTAEVTAFLTGANWLLELGGFDLDLSDGEVMYRTGLVAPNGYLRPSATEIALDRSMHTVKYYAAGLIEVVSGKDPRDVLARIEGK